MKKFLGLLLLVGVMYLAFWPVPVDPVAWAPPDPPPLEGRYAVNDALASVERIDLPEGHGPEDIAVDSLGRIYGGLQEGQIVRLSPDGSTAEVFAETGGRPLGMGFDSTGRLIVADAFRGLLSVDPTGAITTLATEADGRPFRFTNDLDFGPDGRVYFTDASDRFDQAHYKHDLVESRPHGRLLVHDPADGSTTMLLDSLYFANGVAVSPDGAFVLVNETARYRVVRYWLAGPRRGEHEVFIDNLPGFPDGISSNGAGVFWLALASPRNALLDRLAPHPFVRRMILRLPAFVQPAPARYAFVLGLDADGQVRHNLQNPTGDPFSIVTSVEQVGDVLYLGSLEEPALARLSVPD